MAPLLHHLVKQTVSSELAYKVIKLTSFFIVILKEVAYLILESHLFT